MHLHDEPLTNDAPCCAVDLDERLHSFQAALEEWQVPFTRDRNGMKDRRDALVHLIASIACVEQAVKLSPWQQHPVRLRQLAVALYGRDDAFRRIGDDLRALTEDPATPIAWIVDTDAPRKEGYAPTRAIHLTIPRRDDHVCGEALPLTGQGHDAALLNRTALSLNRTARGLNRTASRGRLSLNRTTTAPSTTPGVSTAIEN
jgi:hypothetical protein